MLKNNEWMILNAIIYKIYSMDDIDEMRMQIMKQLRNLIDFDSSSFYLAAAGKENELERPVGIQYSVEDMKDYINEFKNLDYSKGLMLTGNNISYRESDLLPEEVRVKTQYYKEVYDKQGWHFSLHLNISYREQFLGVMSFFRVKGKKNFEYEDLFVLDVLKEHLALRLYKEQEKEEQRKMTVEECVSYYELSTREQEVLRQLMHDGSSEEIAADLNISISTLRKHCHHIYQKLGIGQRIQLYEMIEV
mgnify:CR=1 FL=1